MANHFYDPINEEAFHINIDGEDSSGKWFIGEPIWNTIKLKGLNAAALQYPASTANCGGRTVDGMDISGYPTYHRPEYDSNWPFEERINMTVDMLLSDDPVYDLVLLYFEQPDHDGHVYGPESQEVLWFMRRVCAHCCLITLIPKNVRK